MFVWLQKSHAPATSNNEQATSNNEQKQKQTHTVSSKQQARKEGDQGTRGIRTRMWDHKHKQLMFEIHNNWCGNHFGSMLFVHFDALLFFDAHAKGAFWQTVYQTKLKIKNSNGRGCIPCSSTLVAKPLSRSKESVLSNIGKHITSLWGPFPQSLAQIVSLLPGQWLWRLWKGNFRTFFRSTRLFPPCTLNFQPESMPLCFWRLTKLTKATPFFPMIFRMRVFRLGNEPNTQICSE